eukprot:8738045-Karenia_brevis.AAC.1
MSTFERKQNGESQEKVGRRDLADELLDTGVPGIHGMDGGHGAGSSRQPLPPPQTMPTPPPINEGKIMMDMMQKMNELMQNQMAFMQSMSAH